MPGALSVVLSLRPLLKLSVDSLGCYKVSSLLLHSSPKVTQLACVRLRCIIIVDFHIVDNIVVSQPELKIQVVVDILDSVFLEHYFEVLFHLLVMCSSLVLCICQAFI